MTGLPTKEDYERSAERKRVVAQELPRLSWMPDALRAIGRELGGRAQGGHSLEPILFMVRVWKWKGEYWKARAVELGADPYESLLWPGSGGHESPPSTTRKETP